VWSIKSLHYGAEYDARATHQASAALVSTKMISLVLCDVTRLIMLRPSHLFDSLDSIVLAHVSYTFDGEEKNTNDAGL